MTAPSSLPDGPWQNLFRHALTLIDEIRTHGTANPFWTFGGGTVLMLRYGHRLSKDVDIFVPNPQYLGYVNRASAMRPPTSRPTTRNTPNS